MISAASPASEGTVQGIAVKLSAAGSSTHPRRSHLPPALDAADGNEQQPTDALFPTNRPAEAPIRSSDRPHYGNPAMFDVVA